MDLFSLFSLTHENNEIKSPTKIYDFTVYKSKKMAKTRQKWNQKYQYYIPHASTSLLCIRFVFVAFQSEEEVRWRRGPPVTYFCPAWIRPWTDPAEKQQQL